MNTQKVAGLEKNSHSKRDAVGRGFKKGVETLKTVTHEVVPSRGYFRFLEN